MFDIEKNSEFLKNIEANDNIEQLMKQKNNLLKLLKIILKEVNNDLDNESLNNLDDDQIWAFIFNNSSKSINDFKSKTKNIKEILDELIDVNSQKEMDYNNLGKKTKREKEIEKEKEQLKGKNKKNKMIENEDDDDDEEGEGGNYDDNVVNTFFLVLIVKVIKTFRHLTNHV